MININLIPSHLQKKDSKGLVSHLSAGIPREVVVGVGGVFFFVLFCVHLYFVALMVSSSMELSSWNSQWQSVQPQKKNMDALAQETKDLKKKIDTMVSITSKQSLMWSRNLNVISDNLPKGVWLRKIQLDNNGFTIEGSAFTQEHNEMIIIGDFLTNLKKQQEFMEGFSGAEITSFQASKRKTTDVVDFVILAKLK